MPNPNPYEELQKKLGELTPVINASVKSDFEAAFDEINNDLKDKIGAKKSSSYYTDIEAKINSILSNGIDIKVKDLQNQLNSYGSLTTLKSNNNKLLKNYQDQLDRFTADLAVNYNTELRGLQTKLKTEVDEEKKKKIVNEINKLNSEFTNNALNTATQNLERMSTMAVNYEKFSTSKDPKLKNLVDTSKTDELTMSLALLDEKFAETAKDNLIMAYGGLVAAGGMQMKKILGLKKDQDIFSIDGLTSLISTPIAPFLGKFKNLPVLLQGFITQIDAFSTALIGVTKALIAAPLELIRFSAKMGNDMRQKMIDLNNMLEELQESYDINSDMGQKFKKMHETMMDSKKGLRRDYLVGASSEDPDQGQLAKLFGARGDDLFKQIMKESDTIIRAMGVHGHKMAKVVLENAVNTDQATSNYFYKAKKLMNLADEDIMYLTNVSIATGRSFAAVFTDLAVSTKNAATKFGLDFKSISKDVLTLRKDITNFAHKSSEDLAVVVSKLTQLGVSTQSAMSVFNKFQTFEDAATTAAQLGQSFGMMIDSMALLRAQDPAEIIQMYKDAFEATGQSFNQMDRFSRSLLIQQTGLDDRAAQALFSAENAGKSYEEIMKQVEESDPNTQQLKAMQDMRGAMVELQQTLSGSFTSIFDAIKKGIDDNLSTRPDSSLHKAYMGMSRAVEKIYETFATMDLSSFESSFTQVSALLDKISTYLSSQGFIDSVTTLTKNVIEMIDALLAGDSGRFQKAFQSFTEPAKGIFETFLGFGTEIFKSVLKIFIDGLPTILDVVSDTLDEILNWLNGKNNGGKNPLIDKLVDFLGLSTDEKSVKSFSTKMEEIIKKLFGDSANGKIGIFGKVMEIMDKVFDTINVKLYGSVKTFFEREDVKKAVFNLGAIVTQGLLSRVPGFRSSGPEESISDGVVTQNGKVVKIDSNDQILAMKEGGPISKMLNSSIRQQLTADDVYQASKQGMIDALKAVKTDRPIVIEMNGKLLGEMLVENGITAAMSKPNMTRQYPTLTADSLQYPDSQNPLNRFGT